MSVNQDSALARLARASRSSQPLFHVTISSWWARVLIAGGARPGATDDSMSIRFDPFGPGQTGSHVVDIPRVGHIENRADGIIAFRPESALGAIPLLDTMLRESVPVELDLSELEAKEASFITLHLKHKVSNLQVSIQMVSESVLLLTHPLDSQRSNFTTDAMLSVQNPTLRPQDPAIFDSTLYESASNSANMSGRIVLLDVRSFEDARRIGEAFREGSAVIADLRDTSTNDAKRIVDFVAGLIFVLHGRIERIHDRVFLLTHAGAVRDFNAPKRVTVVLHDGTHIEVPPG